uniref:Uncharacterized protein n=1 Tax=Micrurus spixii TaxID=129469 RepID=A0A2D4MSF3_9SAUR
MLQYLNSQWQEFLENVATSPLLEEDAKDFQFPLGRVKEETEENSEEARGELQSDPNISGKAWVGREKLDFWVKVKMEESLEMVGLESQGLLRFRQFGPQDAKEHQEVSSPQRLKKEYSVCLYGVEYKSAAGTLKLV